MPVKIDRLAIIIEKSQSILQRIILFIILIILLILHVLLLYFEPLHVLRKHVLHARPQLVTFIFYSLDFFQIIVVPQQVLKVFALVEEHNIAFQVFHHLELFFGGLWLAGAGVLLVAFGCAFGHYLLNLIELPRLPVRRDELTFSPLRTGPHILLLFFD